MNEDGTSSLFIKHDMPLRGRELVDALNKLGCECDDACSCDLTTNDGDIVTMNYADYSKLISTVTDLNSHNEQLKSEIDAIKFIYGPKPEIKRQSIDDFYDAGYDRENS